MYVVVKAGGKEYKVAKGDILRIDKMEGRIGDQVTLDHVLMVSQEGETQIGTPRLPNATVTGEIVDQIKGKKVLVFKMKRRKNYRRLRGHRQPYTYVKVKDITLA